jgi:hypothetical protein
MLSRKQLMKLAKTYYISWIAFQEEYEDCLKLNKNGKSYYSDCMEIFRIKFETCLEILNFENWHDYQKSLFNLWLNNKDIKDTAKQHIEVILSENENNIWPEDIWYELDNNLNGYDLNLWIEEVEDGNGTYFDKKRATLYPIVNNKTLTENYKDQIDII